MVIISLIHLFYQHLEDT